VSSNKNISPFTVIKMSAKLATVEVGIFLHGLNLSSGGFFSRRIPFMPIIENGSECNFIRRVG